MDCFVYRVDYSDHFSHSDSSISAINFLQFSELKWDMLAGNRYMYMNRLRHDDFLDLFRQWGHSVLMEEPDVDREIVLTLKDTEFSVDDRFRDKARKFSARLEAALYLVSPRFNPTVASQVVVAEL